MFHIFQRNLSLITIYINPVSISNYQFRFYFNYPNLQFLAFTLLNVFLETFLTFISYYVMILISFWDIHFRINLSLILHISKCYIVRVTLGVELVHHDDDKNYGVSELRVGTWRYMILDENWCIQCFRSIIMTWQLTPLFAFTFNKLVKYIGCQVFTEITGK